MKRTNIKQLFLIYIISFVIGTILFISSFWISLGQQNDVPYVKSFFNIIATCMIQISMLILLKVKLVFFKDFTYRDVVISAMTLFLVNSMLFSYVPFNVSRSVSVMIVGYLHKHPDEFVTKDAIEEKIHQYYFEEEDAVQRRLDEQVNLGNVERNGEAYKLTPKGMLVIEFLGYLTSFYNTNKNYATK